MTLPLNSILEKRYHIENKLGQGGFGAVYQATDTRLNVTCAIKESLRTSEDAARQFKREAEMLAKLRHPNLPRVTDYFDTANGLYLVMDFIEGEDLGALLEKNGKPFQVEQALAWINQICDALIYIHGQNPPIIHRDIKPANIRITPHGKAVLVDFGLAKVDDSAKTSMGARGLTPYFASPEQYKAIGTGTDAQSDIYSLGVTLYCLLTLRIPPESLEIMLGEAEPPKPVKAINRNVPDTISAAIESAMQIRRTERCKSVSDFKDALEGKVKTPAQVKIAPTNKLVLSNGMEFMRVPAGKFIMGSDEGSDNPQHIVNISYDYWMGRFPVTNAQYSQIIKKEFDKSKENHPISYVTWYDAQLYIKLLNERMSSQLPEGYVFCLPNEAEWEKAARGTDSRKYPWGNVFDISKCNTREGQEGETTPVGFYSPHGDSPYECADMSGNVFEWIHSIYKDYPYNPMDGREDDNPTVGRVLRGGSFNREYNQACCSYRLWFLSDSSNQHFGFRVAISPVEEKQPMAKPSRYIHSTIVDFNEINLSNGVEFMRIPSGKFLMGNHSDEKPQHTIDIPYDYWLARFPVTNEQYNFYIKEKGFDHPVEDWQNKGNHPVVNISWRSAMNYCDWLTNALRTELPSGIVARLPTEAEWEKAARGTSGYDYPWGNSFDKDKCNSSESGKLGTTPVDLYSICGNSPYGCADMSGNVWELTHSGVKPYPYNAQDGREDELNLMPRISRGGAYLQR